MKGAAFYVILTAALLAESDAAPAQDSAAGKAVFGKCQACHAVGTWAKNKLGPELNGLAGRKAGAVAGYQYSPALKTSGFAWDQASFAAFMQARKRKFLATKWLSRV
jgi:cytochrome c